MMLVTRDAHETESVAAALGAVLRGGDVVVLNGELGAGKTTFAKGVARALGVREPVTSPTFTLVQEYEAPIPVVHIDVYRLDRIQEVHDLGFDELLDDDRVVLVEWGETIGPALPPELVEVRLAMGDEPDARTIDIEVRGPSWAARKERLDEALAARGDDA